MLKRISALSAKCKLTLLSKCIAPVKYFPLGTKTWPPPFSTQALIAFSNAVVFNVFPSATAPKSLMLKILFEKFVFEIPFTINSFCFHGSDSETPETFLAHENNIRAITLTIETDLNTITLFEIM